jgi:DNA-binding MarR family transcriptional regulator
LRFIECGVNTSRDLLKGIYGTKPSMTKKLQFLEENGFVTKTIDSNDRRVFRYALTKKATDTIKKLEPTYEEAVVDIFEGLTDTEVTTMQKHLEICSRNLSKLIQEEKHKKYQR